jgi:transporter family protein
MSWLIYASLSAVFAALTTLFAKYGLKNIDSNLATAIRTSIILVITWGIVVASRIPINPEKWDRTGVIFLILSAIATGLSWLFYFRALQLADASKVVPIDKASLVLTVILAILFLKEKITLGQGIGIGLITVGTFMVALLK